MPRIEIIPKGWETSRAKERGDGSPSIDVCWSCAETFTEDELVPIVPDDPNDPLRQYAKAGGFDEEATVGSKEVEHPPFEDEDYHCACCDDPLGEEDN